MVKFLFLLWSLLVTAIILGMPVRLAQSEERNQPETHAQSKEATQEKACCSYEVSIVGSPNDDITDTLESALYLYRFQEAGAPSIPLLRRRAEGDHDLTKRVLQSYGYYEAEASSEVQPSENGKSATVVLTIEPGRPFILSEHAITIPDRQPDAKPMLPDIKDLGSPVGKTAVAQEILLAEAAVQRFLQRNGYPYAARTDRDAVADLAKAEIAVRSTYKAGPKLVFGNVSFEGIPDVDEAYLRTYQPWEEGDTVDATQLAEFQQELISTNLFNAGSVTLPETPPEGDAAPVSVVMEQRPFRTFGAGVWYSTDLGPGVLLEFEHRNLFGANETVNQLLEASAEEQRAETRFRKPQYKRPGQDLIAGLSLRHIESDAFDETGGTLTAGLERRLTPHLRVGAGGLIEITDSSASDADGLAILGGIPVFMEYDTSNDILNPTSGIRSRATVTPFAGTFDGDFTPFISADLTGSTYIALDDADRFVFAIRGRVGSILARDISDVPGGRRLYSGGGGSVRGYQQYYIGPLDSNGDPTGGLSVVEAGAEMRARIYGDIGAVVFLEAGSVTDTPAPTFSEGVQYAAGAGLRYYSPIGPIRVDVGVPLNPRSVDNSFEVYFSIGQAF